MAEKKIKKQQEITLYEEDFYEREEVKEETVRLIIFRLSNEWYGVDISSAKHVIKIEKITYLPSSPEHIAGIVNLRGEVLSVTDFKKIFGSPREELTEKSKLVVLEHGTLETGLLVDEVEGIAEIPVSRIDPTLTTIPADRARYVKGQCQITDKLVGILDTEKILTTGRK